MPVIRVLVLASLCVLASVASPLGRDTEVSWVNSGKFEGDIVFEDGPMGLNGLLDPTRYWPNNTLVYDIADGFDQAQLDAINAAFQDYADNTCVHMRLRDPDVDRAYVHIRGSDSGCYSSVGRTGLRQALNLQYNTPGTGCFRHGTIMHELLHALGFYHQQSASDRDDFVVIHYENIQPGYENNFDKYPNTTITDFGVPYDYDSVMHYPKDAFSIDGQSTIVPIPDPDVPIGQRIGLSPSDILKLNSMYRCELSP